MPRVTQDRQCQVPWALPATLPRDQANVPRRLRGDLTLMTEGPSLPLGTELLGQAGASGGRLGTTTDSLGSWGGVTVWEALLGHSSVPQLWGLGQVTRPFSDFRFFICRTGSGRPCGRATRVPACARQQEASAAASSRLLATRPLGRRRGWLCPGPPAAPAPRPPAGPGLPETHAQLRVDPGSSGLRSRDRARPRYKPLSSSTKSAPSSQ